MKAVGFERYLPIDDPESFLDLELPKPSASGRDILVAVKAIAVNPVDTKVRRSKDTEENPARVIGYDAAGIVEAVGDCLLYTSPSPRDKRQSRMPSSA